MLNAAECRLFIPRQKIALARQQLLAAWRSSSTSVEGPKGTATPPPVAQADRQRAEARPGVPPESAWTCPSSHPIKGNFTTSSGERCRSEEHTSELQSRLHLVCRLLLEKKKHTSA